MSTKSAALTQEEINAFVNSVSHKAHFFELADKYLSQYVRIANESDDMSPERLSAGADLKAILDTIESLGLSSEYKAHSGKNMKTLAQYFEKEKSLENKQVIYKENGMLKTTSYANYYSDSPNVKLVKRLDSFENPKEAINYLVRYSGGKLTESDFIVARPDKKKDVSAIEKIRMRAEKVEQKKKDNERE